MSFTLEFYSLSWDALKAALTERKPELLRAIEDRQWAKLLDDCDLGQPEHHLLPLPHDEPSPYLRSARADIERGFDELIAAMAQDRPVDHDPPELSDNAALVFAAAVRQLGKPAGALCHDGSVLDDEDGELPVDFRAMFLNGVAGSCFKDHHLGENLAARPLFGLFHLDFVSWGGLAQREIETLIANYAIPEAEKRDEEWIAIADFAESWLKQLLAGLNTTRAAKTDLVTLYLSVQEHYASVWEEIGDEVRGGFFHRNKPKPASRAS
jgi:hypothetical protein